jgi:hypothetical protein
MTNTVVPKTKLKFTCGCGIMFVSSPEMSTGETWKRAHDHVDATSHTMLIAGEIRVRQPKPYVANPSGSRVRSAYPSTRKRGQFDPERQ